ncbi:MAG: hypothetical protein WA213_07885 [Terriglobales bacterium]
MKTTAILIVLLLGTSFSVSAALIKTTTTWRHNHEAESGHLLT